MSSTKELKLVVKKDSISIFGENYFKSGENWVVPTDLGIHAEVSPALDNLKGIVQCVEGDKKAKKSDQIDHVRINNRTASLAYLEGLISKEVFENVEETEEYIQITLDLAGGQYPVRIYPENSKVVEGTYTKDGEIV